MSKPKKGVCAQSKIKLEPIQRSGFSFVRKTYWHSNKHDEPTFSLIKYNELNPPQEVAVGSFERLSLLSKELSEYVNEVKKGGLA